MILRVLVMVCWLARFAPAQAPGCHPVEADRILGSQLAAALSAFQALPPGVVLGVMPPAGSKRIFHAPELAAIAQRYSIRADLPEYICFEWDMETLDSSRVVRTMRESLQSSSAQIELTETSLAKVPRGRLEFPVEMLQKPSSANQKDPTLWRGEV